MKRVNQSIKTIMTGLIVPALCLTLICGCGQSGAGSSSSSPASAPDLKIVVSIFPVYDWVKNIVGDTANVELLLDDGTDMHSYQASAADIAAITDADVFIYVGGESDTWATDALANAKEDQVTINLMDVLGDKVREEETIEGMEEDDDEEEEEAYDEHVWLSLKNAKSLVGSIADKLASVNKSEADTYEENAATYITQLNNLDEQYTQAVYDATYTTLVFADRFPFLYLVKDYGLKYYAAFPGCSAESDASFSTIVTLAGMVDKYNLPYVLRIDGSTDDLAESVIHNTENKNQTILTMNSMQSVSAEDIEGGTTYLNVMSDNLEVLKKALGAGEGD